VPWHASDFAFDTYELLVLTLTVQPALSEFLIAKPEARLFNYWIGMLFYVPAISGGFSVCWADTSSIGWAAGHPPLEHSAVLFFRICHGLFGVRVAIADFSLHYACRRFRRISCGNGMARRIIRRTQTKGDHPRITQAFSSTGGLLMSGANYLNLTIGHFAAGHSWRP